MSVDRSRQTPPLTLWLRLLDGKGICHRAFFSPNKCIRFFFCRVCNYVFSLFCLCVVVAYKCPSCDKVLETFSGMTKHAGLYHHLERDRGSWKQLHGKAAHALVRRLRGTQAGLCPETSTSATAGESSRRSSPSPVRAVEISVETMEAPAPTQNETMSASRP